MVHGHPPRYSTTNNHLGDKAGELIPSLGADTAIKQDLNIVNTNKQIYKKASQRRIIYYSNDFATKEHAVHSNKHQQDYFKLNVQTA